MLHRLTCGVQRHDISLQPAVKQRSGGVATSVNMLCLDKYRHFLPRTHIRQVLLMRPITSILHLIVFFLLLGFQIGCEGKGQSDSSLSQTNNETASAENKVTLETLLARTDLNDVARSAFERSKKIGQKEMQRSVAEEIIRGSFRKPAVMVPPKTGLTVKPQPQPTLSRNENPVAETEPDTQPLTAALLLDARLRYIGMGVDHFENRLIYGLPDDVRSAAAGWMRRVIEQIPETDGDDQWRSLYDEAATIAARSEILESEPMFCMCRAVAAGEAIGQDAAAKYFAIAMAKFRTSDYPTRIVIRCYGLDSIYTYNLESREIDYYIINVAFFHWIEQDFLARGHEQRFALEEFSRFINWMLVVGDRVALESFEAAVKSSPQLPAWTKAMLLGKLHYQIGYHYRGTGFINTVSKENLEKLEKHCKIAEKHFIEAYRIQPQIPESAEALISIARLGYTEEDEVYWFEKATEYEPEHLQSYNERIVSLYPRWGGSVEEMVDFVLNQTKDTESLCVAYLLPRELLRWRSQKEVTAEQWEEIITDPRINEESLAALDKIISTGRDVVLGNEICHPKFFQTLKAIFAAKAKKYAIAEAAFEELDGQFSTTAIRIFNVARSSFTKMRSSVYAFTSEYQAEAIELQKLWGLTYETRHENADEILKLTDGLADWVNTHSGGLYFKNAREILVGELAFKNKTLPLKFDEDFTVWRSADFSQIKFLDADSVEVDNRKGPRQFQLTAATFVPNAKIFECDFRFPEPEKADSSVETTVVQPSDTDTSDKFRPSVGVSMIGENYLMIGLGRTNQIKNTKDKLRFNGVLSFGPYYWRDESVEYFVKLKTGNNRLKIASGENYIEVYLNDNFVFRSFSKQFQPSTQISFGQPNAARGRGSVVVSSPSVRRWNLGPPPTLDQDADALIEYYQKAVEQDPENAWLKFWLGHAKHLAGDFEGAISHYQQAVTDGVTPRFAGYFIGDAYDRLGQSDEAIAWYRKGVDAAEPSSPHPRATTRSVFSSSNPEDWAALRLQWNLSTKATLTESEIGELKAIGSGNVTVSGSENELSNVSFYLSRSRLKNEYAKTLKAIERQLAFHERSEKTSRRRDLLQPVLDALAEGKAFVQPQSQPPLYLSYRDHDKRFFRHFETYYLNRRFRLFYEPLPK